MYRRRIAITIEVDCDPLPGMCHEPSDWVSYFEHHGSALFPHYHPRVTGVTDVTPADSSNNSMVESTDERTV